MNETRIWVADLLAQFSGQENTLIIPRTYIDVTGSIEDALLLSQIIYWTDRTKMEDGWFAKSYIEWTDEIALSKYQVVSATKRLKDAGIETMIRKFNGAPTVHYRLRKDVFEQWIVKKLHYRMSRNLPNDSEETSQSLTETTAKTTTDSASPNGKVSKADLDAQYDAIAAVWETDARGTIVSMRGMIFGSTKTSGQWKVCQFDPPATVEELKNFGAYMLERMKDKNLTDKPQTPVVVQRWYYDYRAGLQAKTAPPAAVSEAETQASSPARKTEDDFARWMQEQGEPTT